MTYKPKIFISNFPFARYDSAPLDTLARTGWEIIVNPLPRKLKPEETAEFAHDCDGIIAGTENLLPLVEKSTKLKIISRIGIGLDGVPLSLCKEKKITVTYTPNAVTNAVVELTTSLMIALTRQIVTADKQLREGLWTRPAGRSIKESCIGIIGFGRVGSNLARALRGLNPKKILYNDIVDKSLVEASIRNEGANIQFATLQEILKTAHIISLHIPLNKRTRNLIQSKEFSIMRNDSVIINTARGELINEKDLINALHTEVIAGAAIDVYSNEPYTGDLLSCENTILTQHMGSCSYDSRLAMEMGAVRNLIGFMNGDNQIELAPEDTLE